MPFQSEKQRRYLWANEPEIAREWTDRYGASEGGITRIPFAYGPDNRDRVGEEMTAMGTPLTNQMAKVYDKNALTDLGAKSGFFGANDQLEALENYYQEAQGLREGKLGKGKTPGQLRTWMKRQQDIPFGGGLKSRDINMDLVPKDFLINEQDFIDQKSPYDLIKGDQSSLTNDQYLDQNNLYAESPIIMRDFDYDRTTNQEGIDTIDINEMAGQFFRNQPTDERTMSTGLQEKGSGIIDFLMNKGTGLRQGLSLANENYLMPAVAGIATVANRYNPLKEGSQNYNPDLQGQIDMLKASGEFQRLSGDDPSGPYRITGGPLAGKNLVSGFGTNDYGRMLDKRIEYFRTRKNLTTEQTRKMHETIAEKERVEKENAKRQAALRQQVRQQSEANRQAGTGGWQSGMAKDEGFMTGAGTSDTMGSFAHGGLVR